MNSKWVPIVLPRAAVCIAIRFRFATADNNFDDRGLEFDVSLNFRRVTSTLVRFPRNVPLSPPFASHYMNSCVTRCGRRWKTRSRTRLRIRGTVCFLKKNARWDRWRVQQKSDNEVRRDANRMRKVQDRLNEVGQRMCGKSDRK